MNTQIPKEVLIQEARNRGLIQGGPSNMPGIGELLKSSLAGSIKGLEQTGVNILNAPGALLNQFAGTNFQPMQVPESIDPIKQMSLSQHPFALAAQKIPETLMPYATNLALQHLTATRLPATAGIPTRAVAAGLTGYATSPGMEKEKTLTGLGSAAIPVIGGLTETGIGRRITGLSKQQHEVYNQKYSQLFSQAENLPGKKELRLPSALQSTEGMQDLKGMEPKYKESLKRFMANPTLKNAHDAQSDINAGVRAIKNKRKEGIATTRQENFAADTGQDYIARIRGEIMRHFTEKGVPELAEHYGTLTRGYSAEVAPLKFKEAEKARIGKEKISKSKVGRAALNKQEQLEKSGVAEKIPGYRMRQRLEPAMPLIKKSAGGAATLGAIGIGAPYIPSYVYQLLNSIR
jgi:hypothetical protein